jgi:hypothetical protein
MERRVDHSGRSVITGDYKGKCLACREGGHHRLHSWHEDMNLAGV